MTTPLPASPFVEETAAGTFVLNVDAFWEAIEPAPLFIRDPSPGFLSAAELAPIVEVLTAHI